MASVIVPATIEVSVPARTDYLQLLRLNVAGLAASSFDVDEVDDLKIAVEELAAQLIRPEGHDRLELRLSIDADGLVVVGTRALDRPVELELDDFLTTVLDAVVDDVELTHDETTASFRFQKRIRER